MAQPRNLTQFAFAAGIDEGQQAEVLEPTTGFTRLENVRQDKRGALSKRLGYDYLELGRLDGTNRSAGRKLFSHGDRVCTIDGTHLDVYSEQLGCATTVGRVPECSYRLIDAASSTGTNVFVYDLVYCNGVFVITSRDGSIGNAIVASVIDKDGTILRAPEVVNSTSGATGQLATYGTTVVLVCSIFGAGDIVAYALDCSGAAGITGGWTSLGSVASDQRTSPGNVAVASLTDRVAVAYINNSAGASRVTVKTLDSAVLETATLDTNSVTPATVSIDGSIADTLWVAWADSTTTDVKVCGLDADALGTTLATTSVVVSASSASTSTHAIHVVAGPTAGGGRLFVNDSTLDRMQMRNFTTDTGAVVASGSQQTIYNVYVASRPALFNSRYYAICYAGGDSSVRTNTHNLYVLCDLTEMPGATSGTVRPVASVEPGLANILTSNSRVRLSTGPSATKLYAPIQLTRTAGIRATALVEFDFAATTRWQSVYHAGSTFLTAGVLTKFDGSRLGEAGFITKPPKPTSSRSAGALSPATGYRWVAIYETADGDGNWTPSGVSTPSELSDLTASSQYTVSTRPLTMTSRTGLAAAVAERVSFYRTTDGGSVYYYDGSATNSTTSATVSITSSQSDTELQAQARLYGTGVLPGTGGAGQDRRAPPGFSCLVSYADMLVGATGSTLWYSGQAVLGEGVWFNPLFRLDMVDGGDVTALAAQDGTLFVFKRRGIFAVAGEPPSDNGASGGLGTPRRLAVDVGCIDPRSVVVTALGIFFQSERGLEILSRAQSAEWIGEPVQATLASYPVITSAVLDSAAALVRFTCAASETNNVVSDTGVHLVYDLTLKSWVSVDKVTNGNNASRAAQSAAIVYLGGAWRYGWLDKDGRVLMEELPTSGTAYSDLRGYYWVTMLAETAWLKLGGIQGRHMVNKLQWFSRKSTRADYSLSLAYDYSGTYKTARTWAANDLDTLATAIGRTQLEHPLHDEAEGTAVRVLLQDATPTGGTLGTGKGATWIALTFEGTPREGTTVLPETSR